MRLVLALLFVASPCAAAPILVPVTLPVVAEFNTLDVIPSSITWLGSGGAPGDTFRLGVNPIVSPPDCHSLECLIRGDSAGSLDVVPTVSSTDLQILDGRIVESYTASLPSVTLAPGLYMLSIVDLDDPLWAWACESGHIGLIWQAGTFQDVPFRPLVKFEAAQSVPEPSTALLFLMAMAGLYRWRTTIPTAYSASSARMRPSRQIAVS